jgi:hypothetical protein
MGISPDPSGGFSLSLRRIVEGSNGSFRLELVALLTGEDNPAVAGEYTYLVPPGISSEESFILLAEVSPGGGTYLWNTSSTLIPKTGSGGLIGLVLANQTVSAIFSQPLDLNDTVIFVDSGSEFLFTVNAEPLPARLSVERPRSFGSVRVGNSSRMQRLRISNPGGLRLTGIKVIKSRATARHFRVIRPANRALNPGASTRLRIAFRPGKGGSLRGSVTIKSSGGTKRLRLRGRGRTPNLPSPNPNLKPLDPMP